MVADGCAVAVCSGDGFAVLELASGPGDSAVDVGFWYGELGVDCGALAG